MANASTTNFIIKTEDHFIANLDNDGVRIGMMGFAAVDFPASHPEYVVVKCLSAADVEAAFDSYYIARTPVPTNGYRNA